MPLPITALYAGVSVLLVWYLALRVVVLRRKLRIGMGDGNNADLARRIRIHANAIEHAPLVLILLALVEGLSAPVWLLHLFGSSFLAARVLHALGMTRSAGHSFGRFWGVLITWIVMAGLSIAAIVLALTR
jgi:hypothetical protein